MAEVSSMKAKTVVITGAAGGIGTTMARRFGREGARLGLLDLDPGRLDVLAAEMKSLGIDAIPIVCDITDVEQCKRAIAEVTEAYGGVDVVINNAGLTHLSPFAETDITVYRTLMDVNVFGAVNVTQAALDSLLARRGTVVVMSSVAGFTPLAIRSGYSAAKHALHGLFDTMRAELEPQGLRVLVVCPGFTKTDMGSRALGADGGAVTHRRTTVGAQADPTDVADAIYQGVVKGRRLMVMSLVGKIAFVLWRVWPSFYQRLMMRSLERDAERAREEERRSAG